ncbi:MAG: hypothetical protein ACI9G1_003311, partial [Pirellulaceae bacterium]
MYRLCRFIYAPCCMVLALAMTTIAAPPTKASPEAARLVTYKDAAGD